MINRFFDSKSALDSPPSQAFEITPSDSADLPFVTRGIYVGGSGDLRVTLLDGATVTYKNIAGGVHHGMRVQRVHATGTTATSLLGVL